MVSTFHSIETAKRSLFTHTTALSTTGHNIANANTPGYSRQRVNMNAALSIEAFGMNHSTAPGQLGTGVEFNSITRIREAFLDAQYRGEATSLGSWTIQSDTLNKLEGIFNEPSDTGIRTVLDKFWKSWSELSKDPQNETTRKVVKETAAALTDALNYMSRQLNKLSDDLTTNVSVKTNEIQTHLESIANLNGSIYKLESLGDNANDLRDQRDLLTDQLSKIVNIGVQETDQGYTITLGGQAVVTGTAVVAVNPALLEDAYNAGTITGGELYGMFYSRNEYVADYKNQLDAIANTLANGDIQVTLPKGSVLPSGVTVTDLTGKIVSGTINDDTAVTVKGLNGLHQLGYALDGSLSGGLPFFESQDGTPITAGNIRLNAKIQEDPRLIATSMRTIGTSPNAQVVAGNNSLALLISNLKDLKFQASGTTQTSTIDSLYSSLVGQLGVQGQEAARQTENASLLLQQVDSMRESVSGVSLDEEMSDLVKFQHAYNASARFMTTFDEMLDKLINGTGVVGR